YLVKPVRAASLAAQMTAKQDIFERATSEAGAPDIADARVDGNAGGLAILVAEGNEINAVLARSLLGRLGHRPTVAPAGYAAARPGPRPAMPRSKPGSRRRRRARPIGSCSWTCTCRGATASQRPAASARSRPSGARRAPRSSRSPPTPSTRTAKPALPPAWT